jgi:hypothetical protein
MADLIGRLTDRRSPDAEPETTDRESPAPASDSRPTLDRRRLLTAGGATTATLLAGCAGLVPDGGAGPDDGSEGGTATPDGGGGGGGGGNESTSTPTAAGTPTGETDVAGLVPKADGDQYEFIVTLAVPAGAGGADWWQVETLDGEQLGRREFDSPRSDTQFTTSKTVGVEDESAVVVRGHHAEAGYGGQVILLDMESGSIDVARQGAERESFEDYSF